MQFLGGLLEVTGCRKKTTYLFFFTDLWLQKAKHSQGAIYHTPKLSVGLFSPVV